MEGGFLLYTVWLACILIVVVHKTNSKVCWDKQWFNNSSPSDHHGSEFEQQNKTVLDKICPDGNPVIDAHCKDEKGEPFRGFKNDTANHYVATCNITVGLVCHPYSNATGSGCADFAIQYGCNCPTTTVPGSTGGPVVTHITTASVTTTSSPNVTNSPSSVTPKTAATTSVGNIGGTKGPTTRQTWGINTTQKGGVTTTQAQGVTTLRVVHIKADGTSGASTLASDGGSEGDGKGSENGLSGDGQNSALGGNQCTCRSGGQKISFTAWLMVVVGIIKRV